MISIITPVYNGYEYAEDCINSVLSQTFTDWEMIIGVNGYSQNSDVYNKLKKYENDKIKVFDLYYLGFGKVKALHKMLSFCNNDIICMMDIDDIWYHTKLEEQIKFITKYDVVGTRCQYFGKSSVIPYIPIGEVNKNVFFNVNPIINSSAMFYKKDAKWDEKVEGVEDYEMWLRLNFENKKFYNIYKILTYYRIHESSICSINGRKFDNYIIEMKQKWNIK